MRIDFSTLWSNLDLKKRWLLQYHINDFKYIQYKEEHIDALDYNNFHADALSYLNSKLNQTDMLKTIIISHHCPIMLPIPHHVDFQSAYCSSLEELILKYQPLYWLYGHTHTSDPLIQIGETELVTNPFDVTQNN